VAWPTTLNQELPGGQLHVAPDVVFMFVTDVASFDQYAWALTRSMTWTMSRRNAAPGSIFSKHKKEQCCGLKSYQDELPRFRNSETWECSRTRTATKAQGLCDPGIPRPPLDNLKHIVYDN
jgi:hypothetical protein